MWATTPGCSVDGRSNPSAYGALLYDFDLAEGAVVLEPDESAPLPCGEHAHENERGAVGERRPGSVVAYPCTDRLGRHALDVCRQPQAHHPEERARA